MNSCKEKLHVLLFSKFSFLKISLYGFRLHKVDSYPQGLHVFGRNILPSIKASHHECFIISKKSNAILHVYTEQNRFNDTLYDFQIRFFKLTRLISICFYSCSILQCIYKYITWSLVQRLNSSLPEVRQHDTNKFVVHNDNLITWVLTKNKTALKTHRGV